MDTSSTHIQTRNNHTAADKANRESQTRQSQTEIETLLDGFQWNPGGQVDCELAIEQRLFQLALSA